MAEGNESSQEKQKYDPEELQHVCKYENDDDGDDESFHSLDKEHAEEFYQKIQNAQSERNPPTGTSMTKERSPGYMKRSGSECIGRFSSTDSNLGNQCIDENSANDSAVCGGKTSYGLGQELQNGPNANKVQSVFSGSDDINSSDTAFLPSERDNASTTIIYQRNGGSGEDISLDTRCSRETNKESNASHTAFVSSERDKASTTIIYHRNEGDDEDISLDARYSRVTNEPPLERSTSCTDECPHHNEEILKYLCMSCYKLACQVCFTIEHQNCHAREFIPTLVAKSDFHFGEKCKAFEADLDKLQKRLKLNKRKCDLNIKVSERMRIKAKSEFKKQRDEINKMFDSLEQDFDKKIGNLENSDKGKMQMLISKQEKIDATLQEHMADYYDRRDTGNVSRVFTKMEMSKEITDEMKKDLENLEMENTIKRYIYTPSKVVMDFPKNISELGSLEEVDSKTKRTITDTNRIKMKLNGDQNACKISSLVLLSERHLLAVDYGNSSLKIVDIFNDNDVTCIPMAQAPFDVALASDREYAHGLETVGGKLVLTLPKENKLFFMEYTLPDSFIVKRDVETNGQCRGIAYSDQKLYLTFPSQGKIEVTDMQGELLKRITTETIGQVFQPQFIAVNEEGCVIFISDKDNHAIFSLTKEGEITAIYTDHDLIEPRGLCVNLTGAVFVCSFATHKIYHLSENCELISSMSVADVDSPTPYPFSITYCDRNHTMYVGQFTRDCIKAYKIV